MQTGILIRPIQAGDLTTAAQVIATSTGGEFEEQLELLRRRLARGTEDSPLLVAEAEAQVVGVGRVAYFEPASDAPPNAAPSGWYLLGVNVAPNYRRRGIGKALTVERLKWIAERARVAWFFTDATNAASIRLHEALGFHANSRDFWFPTASFGAEGGVLFSVVLTR